MPSAEAVKLVLAAVPGVADADVESRGESQGSLRIRVAEGFDARSVAEQVSAVLRERFSIRIPPEALLPESQDEHAIADVPPAEGEGTTVVLHEADTPGQQETEALRVDLPGWDTVLVRAQESAARVASSAALATATSPIRTGPEREIAPGPLLTAVPEPFEDEPREAPEADLLVEARERVEALRSRAEATVDALRGTPGTGRVRVVDASVEGEGSGRRAIVVISRTEGENERFAIGAALAAGADDAVAIAAAAVAAIRDLA